ncbi:TadE/TadG family type IV pilus assembly protein [Luteococcus sp. OSA5]|uniref:TadE/TadG family type IV pilus assembly protein n=1 Tax=Luteococcus sp. OSA5 TaxID=3401630 RepID=UPI003B42E544
MSESVQWTILLPLLMLMVLGVVQAAIVLYGRSVAAAAALAGAEAQALAGAHANVASQVARDVAEQGGLRDVRISVDRDADITVQVAARVDTFWDIGPTQVNGRAVMPREES